MDSNEVPTGRRMNGAQMFTTAEIRNPKLEYRRKSEARIPKPPSHSDVFEHGSSEQSRRDADSRPCERGRVLSAFGFGGNQSLS